MKRNPKRKRNGMNHRWLVSYFCVFAVLLAFVFSALFVFVVNYHYEYAYSQIDTRASNLVNNYFNPYLDGTEEGFHTGAFRFVEDFSDKSMMEVWVLDQSGKPIVSSSGFSVNPDAEMPDYALALQSTAEKGKWVGRNENGEKIMAVTTLLPARAGAVRLISSMQNIDRQLFGFALVIFGFGVLLRLGVWLLIYPFIRAIARSLGRINQTARSLGKGDWSARVDLEGMHDEVSDLGRSFNNMAVELSKAESLKNDFISTISHELRTPLTAIKGWGETIIQLGDTDGLKRHEYHCQRVSAPFRYG